MTAPDPRSRGAERGGGAVWPEDFSGAAILSTGRPGAKVPQDARIELPWQPNQDTLIAWRGDRGKRLFPDDVAISQGF
jgi:hypothetical protein